MSFKLASSLGNPSRASQCPRRRGPDAAGAAGPTPGGHAARRSGPALFGFPALRTPKDICRCGSVRNCSCLSPTGTFSSRRNRRCSCRPICSYEPEPTSSWPSSRIFCRSRAEIDGCDSIAVTALDSSSASRAPEPVRSACGTRPAAAGPVPPPAGKPADRTAGRLQAAGIPADAGGAAGRVAPCGGPRHPARRGLGAGGGWIRARPVAGGSAARRLLGRWQSAVRHRAITASTHWPATASPDKLGKMDFMFGFCRICQRNVL